MADCGTISQDTDHISFEDDEDDISFIDDFDIFIEDDYDVHKELIRLINNKVSVSSIKTSTIENARRFIFAEDLVSFIALEFHGLVYNTRHNKGSDLYFSPSYETIRHAVRIIRMQINNANSPSFEIIVDLSKLYKLCFEIFMDAVLNRYSEGGLKVGQFFYFSVYASELAARCYRTDFEEVFEFAVYAILDAFFIFKGRRYEYIDFAKAVVNKSESFNQENMGETSGINRELLKSMGKSRKSEIIDLLNQLMSKNIGNNQQSELDECAVGLEQLSLIDKYDKYEVLGNFEFLMEEMMGKSGKSVESHIGNYNLSFCNEDCCISLIDKVHNGKCKKIPYPTENEFFDEILHELLSVINSEASLFSSIYASPKNQLESQDNNNYSNTKNKTESSTYSISQNIQVRDSCCSFKESVPPSTIDQKVETSINASVTPDSAIVELENKGDSANSSDTSQHENGKFSNKKSNMFGLEQNEFNLQRSTDNKVKSATSEFAINYVQAELEKTFDDKSGCVNYNIIEKVEHNFIEKETKIFKEDDVISNSKFVQKTSKETLEDFSDITEYEKLNFRNTELKKVDIIQDPLICKNASENNDDKHENDTQLGYKSTEDLHRFYDNIVLSADKDDKQIIDFFVVYKSEGDINEENLKVLKGDTVLFAEDLVKYIIQKFHCISYSESKFDGIHFLLYDAFGETVKEVLNFIHNKSEILNKVVFEILANVKENKRHCFRKYVAMVLSHYVENGLNSDAFLYFCLHFSELAAKFYTPDHPEILEFAICSILDAFCLLKDDWCEFKVVVGKVLDIFKTKPDNQCSDHKIHFYVDKFEEECVKTILNTLKTFLDEMIEEKINDALLSKILEDSDTNVDNLQSGETEAVNNWGKKVDKF